MPVQGAWEEQGGEDSGRQEEPGGVSAAQPGCLPAVQNERSPHPRNCGDSWYVPPRVTLVSNRVCKIDAHADIYAAGCFPVNCIASLNGQDIVSVTFLPCSTWGVGIRTWEFIQTYYLRASPAFKRKLL